MVELSEDGYRPEWLELEKALGSRPAFTGTIEEMEQQFVGLGAALAAQMPPPDTSVSTVDEDADGVPVRIYTPDARHGKLPIGVYYHGGGYCVGDLNSEDSWCRYIAKSVPCIIVSVDYRLAPKHKMPVMLDDSIKAWNWAYHNASKYNADNTKAFTIGASAGGGLALTVADSLIASGKKSQIAGIVALVPVTAHYDSVPSAYKDQYTAYVDNKSGVPIIDKAAMDTFFEAAAVDSKDPKVFATLSKNLNEFPPTYIATCGKDPLRDDGKILGAMLEREQVKVKHDFWEGVPHYFWLFPGLKIGGEFLDGVANGVKFVLGEK